MAGFAEWLALTGPLLPEDLGTDHTDCALCDGPPSEFVDDTDNNQPGGHLRQDVPAGLALPNHHEDSEENAMVGRNTSSRRWDGVPETDADRRFFDLRESGFRGPIDQDGNPQTPAEHEQWLADARTSGGEAS